jgi:hypothetical protein
VQRSEQRKFTRVPFDAKVELTLGEYCWESELVDISLKGALISRPADFDCALNEPGELSLKLADSDIELNFTVTLMHIELATVGLRCDHIDVESLSHLRCIVEFNSGDPDLLHRELSALCN